MTDLQRVLEAAAKHIDFARDDAKDGDMNSAQAHARIAYDRLRDWFSDPSREA